MMGYPNNKQKEFKADRFKQYLITRSVSAKMALELCIAGKITLQEIPIYTDKFTLLHFGQIQVEPEVDREILRISALDQRRREDPDPSEIDPSVGKPVLCDDCGHGRSGADECKVEEYTYNDCADYLPPDDNPPDSVENLEDQADHNKQREAFEQDQQQAEDEATTEAKVEDEMLEYKCELCSKSFKTKKGCLNHLKNKHNAEGK
ncbi:hypothetical protein LCGC14_0475330 [marine sediment metagenome]|uniref:C2H2-type domain-containing protein n=1 Tax=marine sediment metagenome TaxID=412755 RepID=A0A0F9SAY3_9ZZZZ